MHKRRVIYAIQSTSRGPGAYMHRLVLGVTDPKIQVDHRDRDGLNNQCENLRIADSRLNHLNSDVRFDSTSGFRGVSWYSRGQKWRAHVSLDRRYRHLGLFDDPIEAAKARDEYLISRLTLARCLELNCLNFPR